MYSVDTPNQLPPAQGLYDPANEHDACGIGFVVNIKGEPSHDIVLKGLQILENLVHRGACGCDPETGDGAGLLIQIPHKFFAREAVSLGFSLPNAGEYGIAMCFLPVDRQQRLTCEGVVERFTREEGLTVLGWRDTPVEVNAIGRVARASQPYIEQFFVARPAGMTQDTFERKLYVVRKRAEAEVAAVRYARQELLLHSFVLIAHDRLQGTAARESDRRVLQRTARSGHHQRHVPGAPAVFDQHVSHLATGASVPLSSAITARSIRFAAT